MMKKTIALLTLTVLVAGCSSGKQEGSEKNVTKARLLVKTMKVQRQYIAEKLTYYGTVTGVKEAQIYPDMPGKLIEYRVKEGQHVNKDQVIALLDRSLPGMNYEPLVVKSPISGVVAFTYARPGQMCAPQMPIALVVDNRKLEVQADVPPDELSKLHVNQKAIIHIGQQDSVVSRIKSVSAAVDPMRKVGQIKVAATSPKLMPGMMVKVDVITAESQNAVVVPTSAVITLEGKRFVFVVEDGVARMREVTTGIESGNMYEIKSGLKAGEIVVVEGAEGLSDGQPVEVAKW